MVPYIVAVLTLLIILHFLLPIQERYSWIKPIGNRVSVANYDVNYGVSTYIP